MSIDHLTIIISFTSLLVSIFVASTSYWKSRAKIKITQSENEDRSWILKSYDGSLAAKKHKSMSPNMESIALIEVIITNESSLPISILEFQIEGAQSFTSYSYTKGKYKVTPENGSSIDFSSPDDPLDYIKPEFTIEPYTSMRGHILFWMNSKDSIQPGKHKMTVITSRKKFTRKIKINEAYESAKANLHRQPEFLPFE